MPRIQLEDMTLFACEFRMRVPDMPDEDSEEEIAKHAEEASQKMSAPYPEEQLLELAVESGNEGSQYYAFIEGRLDDDRLPFSIDFEMGFKFEVPDAEGPAHSVDDLESTFVWLAFPYMRQLIADLTGRSPVAQYFAPPLSRLPKPDAPSGSVQGGGKEAKAESSDG
jgi:hypothetical protein